jgi:squalene-associated FAD-dependent desaturase
VGVALLRAKGLNLEDKLALARFSTTARWMGWELHNDCSVAELLERFDQTERLQRLMWRPLCLAALNTAAERASAKVFLAVLRDSLGGRRAASDMLLPRVDLSALFPERAAAFLAERGMAVHTGCRVNSIERSDRQWRINTGGAPLLADAVIVATTAGEAARLLNAAPGTPDARELDHEPIVTCYLQYDEATALPHPFYALIDDPDAGRWGQFVFDRGQLHRAHAGMLSVVVSAAERALDLPQAELASRIAMQLQRDFDNVALGAPRWSKVISEKRATFSCTPGLIRPQVDTGIPGLARAGDYVAGPYPGTLESAVRSGIAAARHVGGAIPGRAGG